MSVAGLHAHLAFGATTVCRCWAVTRKDGGVLGFTDHDRSLAFDGIAFRADTGLTAHALQQTTGLSVDNTEALGALSDVSLREADLEAGRFDGAEVSAWLVNWAKPEERMLQFRGTIGETSRIDGAFRAELRGLAEALNQPRGKAYQAPCGAVLGDQACGFDLELPGYTLETEIAEVRGPAEIFVVEVGGADENWFSRGAFRVLGGAAAGLASTIKRDVPEDGLRRIELWQELRVPVSQGDQVLLTAGCDKTAETCRAKFNNFMNFRGFPHIPGEDWLMSYPRGDGANDGGSLGG